MDGVSIICLHFHLPAWGSEGVSIVGDASYGSMGEFLDGGKAYTQS